MILQALYSYYKQLLDDPKQDVPEPGYSKEKIHFELLLSPKGELISVNDLRVPAPKGKKLLPRPMNVPKDKDRTSGVHAYPYWEKRGYALGNEGGKKTKRVEEQHQEFKDLNHRLLDGLDDQGARALLTFLDSWDPEGASELAYWDEMEGANMVFRLDGDRQYLHEREALRRAWSDYLDEEAQGVDGFCLVSNRHGPISETHPFMIRGVRGAQTSGAALVSFNATAFTSYGKTSSLNAPVSEEAAYAYLAALKHLLAPDSKQKVQIGDATTVFWTEETSRVPEFMAAVLGGEAEGREGQDESLVNDLREMLDALAKGDEPAVWDVDSDTPFYVLGLSPNASRLAVRFWHQSTVDEISRRLADHYNDLRIDRRYDREPEYPGQWRLLIQTASQGKSENISPVLGGELTYSILTGADYPRTILSRVIGRIRAEQEVTTFRAALIKAYYARILRKDRSIKNISTAEVLVSLNEESTNIGYRLGRLFAVLEKAQRDALGQNINATIKDRFFGAASATPASVFPRLIRLAQHHISKAEYGGVSDRRMAEIIEGVDEFPKHLDLDGQAMFALGYYHQRNALYAKKTEEQAEAAQA